MQRRHRSSRGRILKVDLEAFTEGPLNRRIYLSIRRDILEQTLLPNTSLPSTRQLAADLGVSRGTVVSAYEQLRAEGYVRTDAGGGTRVSPQVPDTFVRAEVRPDATPGTVPVRRASRRGQRITGEHAATPVDLRPTGPRAFRTVPPAIDVFPVETWTRIATKQWRRATTRDLSYGTPMGYLPLRKVIAEYVSATRGVRCTADQVLVVAGAQQALDIAARALLDPGDKVWIEDPGYFGARGAAAAAGADVAHIGVDEQGIDVAEGRRVAPGARMAFVTPSHQVPLGMPMSLDRRRQLIEWANDADAWILEDDYNSDFHYASRPMSALRSLDRSERVIYCSTFNKSLFPALRLGFLVAPESVMPALVATRFFSDLQPPYLDQATLGEFIAEGHYERHIRRLRSIYETRRAVLMTGLEACTPWLTAEHVDSGRELIVSLKYGIDDVRVAQAADRAGLSVMPLTPWAIAHETRSQLRLGYSGIDEADIAAGATLLGTVLANVGPGLAAGSARHISVAS